MLPLLAAVMVWAARGPRRRWAAPIAMAVGAGGRPRSSASSVVGGLGGYEDYPWTPLRFAVGLGSYVLAALSPPQFELLRDPALLIVPFAALVFIFFAARALRRRGERERLRLAAAGVAWFAIALLPALNLAVDLNTSNGERLLFLPSVGLALAFGALVPIRSRATLVSLASAGAAAARAVAALGADLEPGGRHGRARRRPGRGARPAERRARRPHRARGVPQRPCLPGRDAGGGACSAPGRTDLRVAPCVPVIVPHADARRRARRAAGRRRLRRAHDVGRRRSTSPCSAIPAPVTADCLWDAPRRLAARHRSLRRPRTRRRCGSRPRSATSTAATSSTCRERAPSASRRARELGPRLLGRGQTAVGADDDAVGELGGGARVSGVEIPKPA